MLAVVVRQVASLLPARPTTRGARRSRPRLGPARRLHLGSGRSASRIDAARFLSLAARSASVELLTPRPGKGLAEPLTCDG